MGVWFGAGARLVFLALPIASFPGIPRPFTPKNKRGGGGPGKTYHVSKLLGGGRCGRGCHGNDNEQLW